MSTSDEENDIETIKYAKTVELCGVCKMPPEYCEFSDDFPACVTWLRENAMNVCERLYPEPEAALEVWKEWHKKKAAALAAAAEAAEAALASQAAGEGEGEEESGDGKKKKKKGVSFGGGDEEGGSSAAAKKPKVRITASTRGGRKMITTVSGLAAHDVSAKDAQKLFAKKFSVGVTAAKGVDEIDIQGDKRDDVKNLLITTYSIPEKAIVVVEETTKMKKR